MEGNTFDIADPYISDLLVQIEHVPASNEKTVAVRNCIGGVYNVYHQCSKDGSLINLVALHNSYTLKDLEEEENIDSLGYASTSLSGEIVLIDEQYRFNAEYSYYALEADAYYDAAEVLLHIDEMEYITEVKDKLRVMLEGKRANGEQPKGKDIIPILGALPIWPGFKKMGPKSTHWSEDLFKTLEASYKPASIIKGGVVSIVEKGFVRCFCYRNTREKAYAICIELESQDIDESSLWNIQ